MNRENTQICLVFAMGMEMGPFLKRGQLLRRWTRGKAAFREVFFEGDRLLVVRCGIGPERASQALAHLEHLPAAVISVGTAGALVKDLRFLDLVLASETCADFDAQGPFQSDPALVDCLSRACCLAGRTFRIDRLVTTRKAVFNPEARGLLHQASEAAAVDMESYALAKAAKDLGVPFACVRVISDDFSSPSIPLRRSPRISWNSLTNIPADLEAMFRWSRFLLNFKRSIEVLPPVLVRFIRELRRVGPR